MSRKAKSRPATRQRSKPLRTRSARRKAGSPVHPATSDGDTLFESIKGLAASLHDLQELAVAQYTPVVETIITTRSRDVRHIEHTLDYLLDIACHPAGLLLYRRLCSHYWDIDPAATAAYVHMRVDHRCLNARMAQVVLDLPEVHVV